MFERKSFKIRIFHFLKTLQKLPLESQKQLTEFEEMRIENAAKRRYGQRMAEFPS